MYETDIPYPQLDLELKTVPDDGEAREWLRKTAPGAIPHHMWVQTLMPMLQHVYAADKTSRTEAAFLERASVDFRGRHPDDLCQLMTQLVESSYTKDQEAFFAQSILRMTLSDRVVNEILLDEFKGMCDSKSTTHKLPGVCEVFLTLDNLAKLTAWQIGMIQDCPLFLLIDLVTSTTFTTLCDDCPDFSLAVTEAGWRVYIANYLNRSKLGGGEFAALTEIMRPYTHVDPHGNIILFTSVPRQAYLMMNKILPTGLSYFCKHHIDPHTQCVGSLVRPPDFDEYDP